MFKYIVEILIFLSVLYCKEASANCGPPIVVCYFTNWAWYRSGVSKFMPSNIDINLCTHIYYGFARLHPVSLTIVPTDPWADFDNHFYNQITSLKNQGKVVLLSIGGWTDSQGDTYSRLVSNINARQNFIVQSRNFVQQYGFQGLDIDWEYPVCWQGNCGAGPASDKQNFINFLIGMRSAYSAAGLLVTAAVSASTWVADNETVDNILWSCWNIIHSPCVKDDCSKLLMTVTGLGQAEGLNTTLQKTKEYYIEKAYNVPLLSQYLDLIGVMNYDYHGYYNGVTGPNSPYISYDGSASTFQTLDYYVKKGANPCKLLVGVPMYARTFTLANSANTYFGAAVTGPGTLGPYTGESGFLSYYEMCSAIKTQCCWTVVRTYEKASYAYRYNQWASYCGPEDMITRAKLILNYPFRGAMVWALDLDDFNNICGCGRYPLLRTLNVGLGRIPGSPATCP